MTAKTPRPQAKDEIEYDDAEVFLAWDENGLYVSATTAEEAIESLEAETDGQLRSVARIKVKLPVPTIQDGGGVIIPASGQALKVVS